MTTSVAKRKSQMPVMVPMVGADQQLDKRWHNFLAPLSSVSLDDNGLTIHASPTATTPGMTMKDGLITGTPSCGDLGAGTIDAQGQIRSDGTVTGATGLYDGAFRIDGVLLTQGSYSVASTVDITLSSYVATYRALVILLNYKSSVDSGSLFMRVNADGSSTFDAAAGNYGFASMAIFDNSSGNLNISDSSSGPNFLGLTDYWNGELSNNASATNHTIIEIQNPNSSAGHQVYREYSFFSKSDHVGGITGSYQVVGGGTRLASQKTKAVRFALASGTLTGDYAVYGKL